MNIITFFLARKIVFKNVYQKGISTMTLICFAGIFIGSFSLALVTAIMHGFETVIHKKMQNIHSDIIIQAYGEAIDMDVLAPVLVAEFPDIKAFSPQTTRTVLINTKQSTPTVVMIKGIDPTMEQQTNNLSHKIIRPTNINDFTDLFKDNHLIIGKQLAINNHLMVGDIIELLFSREEEIRGNKVTFDSQKAIVGGVFETGIDEFDSSVIYCSFSLLETLFPDVPIEQINLTITPGTNETNLINNLHNRLGLDVYSWKDLYPTLVATLKLEKYVAFFILALIILVASMNNISLLFMQITQKRPDIALLKAIGMTNNAISSIFFMMGMGISIVACCCGLIGACIAGELITRYPFITLPDTYYVTHLPIAMEWQILVSVFCVVIFFSFFATWFPAQRIKSINISHVLRFEG
jgi:lipoprotein-releasing system permease protein